MNHIPRSKVELELRKSFDEHAARVKFLQQLYEHERLVTAGIARFGGTYYVNVFWLDKAPEITWLLSVASFREAEPIIEFIEGWRLSGFALECKRTNDYTNLSHRDFLFPGLRLTCELKSDSDACRRVIVGMTDPEPIYEFQCEETA